MQAKHVMNMFNSLYSKIYTESDHLNIESETKDRFQDKITAIKLEVLNNYFDSFADEPELQALINEELVKYVKEC